MFLLAPFLALIWVAITNDFGLWNAFLGLALSFLLLIFSSRVLPHTRIGKRTTQRPLGARLFSLLQLTIYFFYQLIFASIDVLFAVVRPSRLRPGIIAVPLDLKTDAQITLLGNLITLTPGTLTLDVSPDRQTIYIHAIRVQNPKAFRKQIKNGFERLIKLAVV